MSPWPHVVVSVVAIVGSVVLAWHGSMSGTGALTVIGLALGSHVASTGLKAFAHRG